MNISKHAAGYFFAHADLGGNWQLADRTLFVALILEHPADTTDRAD